MHFHIITLFPDMFDSYLRESIIARAIKEKKIKISLYNPRDYTTDRNKKVDRKPYGGGPGMVLEATPILKAVDKAVGKKKDVKVIFLSPGGKEFSNVYADKAIKKHKHIVIIAGRYEGIDARVIKALKAEEVSIGDYTLTGGELPAMVMVDVISRRISGVLGNIESVEERRVSSKDVYTRPESFKYKGKEYKVPKVLLSGHHKDIEEWKKKK